MSMQNIHNSASDQSQRYAAAESLLQHSRPSQTGSRNINGFMVPNASFQSFQQPSQTPLSAVPVSSYPDFKHSFQHSIQVPDQIQGYSDSIEPSINSPPGTIESPDQQSLDTFPECGRTPALMPPGKGQSPALNASGRRHLGHDRSGSHDQSDTINRTSSREFTVLGLDLNGLRDSKTNKDEDHVGLEGKDEVDQPPAWSELKTKAGKERKRLPLACIACRRKKIRCSGEKPACKHCLRSRIPCVYKVTARKAAPRTDYMAMLDKRLKRMEERVIKMIPKEELSMVTTTGRANVRPTTAGDGKAHGGKKRVAVEAFGPDLNDWADSKLCGLPGQMSKVDGNRVLSEGAKNLPTREIQEHLAEVFFDCLYGQSYHLLHKPSFMERLRARTVPPVLILAVCAISARFSTHPKINSEPEFLRGEEWAAPARDIALKYYDEPSITIVTVLLILGLHEFGTCQGGRSWMFGGMATRMAYALQLHQELDHDPMGQGDKSSKLSFTDREIRRRVMWACFLMDRFNSSGTERPACANEETIKVQLPIKESFFQMEVSGPTEDLAGYAWNTVAPDAGQIIDPKENMGVASYIVRAINLWGRVIKYMNLGGKEVDESPIWRPESQFARLKKQAENFQRSLPPLLQNNVENLKCHAAEKLANQFLFMHIASYQVVLFLHRFAIPNTQAAKMLKDMPKDFVAEAGRSAIEAANQISYLLTDAVEYSVFAPFAGYCAFMSSTVLVWGAFSNSPEIEATSRENLACNVKYLGIMKKYWGMFHFIGQDLKDMYRQQGDASMKGINAGETNAAVFQYGDWFQKYPHGVSKTDYEDPIRNVKEEPGSDIALSQKPDVEEVFRNLSPPSRVASIRKAPKRQSKKSSHSTPSHPPKIDGQELSNLQIPSTQQPMLPIQLSNSHSSMSPTSFSPHHNQPFCPPIHTPMAFSSGYDLPQLDRQLVYGAYTGSDPTASSSTSVLNAIIANNLQTQNAQNTQSHPNPSLWNSSAGMPDPAGFQQQQAVALHAASHGTGYMGGMVDMQTSAWFMPFNLNPPEIVAAADEFENVPFGSLGMGDGMGGAG